MAATARSSRSRAWRHACNACVGTNGVVGRDLLRLQRSISPLVGPSEASPPIVIKLQACWQKLFVSDSRPRGPRRSYRGLDSQAILIKLQACWQKLWATERQMPLGTQSSAHAVIVGRKALRANDEAVP